MTEAPNVTLKVGNILRRVIVAISTDTDEFDFDEYDDPADGDDAEGADCMGAEAIYVPFVAATHWRILHTERDGVFVRRVLQDAEGSVLKYDDTDIVAWVPLNHLSGAEVAWDEDGPEVTVWANEATAAIIDQGFAALRRVFEEEVQDSLAMIAAIPEPTPKS